MSVLLLKPFWHILFTYLKAWLVSTHRCGRLLYITGSFCKVYFSDPHQGYTAVWHWNGAPTRAQLFSLSCWMPFIPDNYSPAMLQWPCSLYPASPVWMTADKSPGLLLASRHYVIPLQGSVLLAKKPTTTRALKNQAEASIKLPISCSNISSDNLLTTKLSLF